MSIETVALISSVATVVAIAVFQIRWSRRRRLEAEEEDRRRTDGGD
jgi:hypothetical protein